MKVSMISTSTVLTPLSAYKKLKQGNTFYQQGFAQNIQDKKPGEKFINPFALVFSSDNDDANNPSVFGQSANELYSLPLSSGSITGELIKKAEYACINGSIKIIVVMVHTQCEVVKTFCNTAGSNIIEALLNKIHLAVNMEQSITHNRHGFNTEFVEKVTQLHVKNITEEITNRSPILRNLIQSGSVGLVGCVYNKETGKVTFLQNCMVLGSVWVNE
jgi:carbonic anhydrase